MQSSANVLLCIKAEIRERNFKGSERNDMLVTVKETEKHCEFCTDVVFHIPDSLRRHYNSNLVVFAETEEQKRGITYADIKNIKKKNLS